uniref:Uncharacterized protein n=1 Tax=Rhinolophus ferrumequinum TaxID=59479 RepID=A0A671EU43_RHIFE
MERTALLNKSNFNEINKHMKRWVGGGWHFSLALLRDFLITIIKKGYDMRLVNLTPLEQRKLTFDTHAFVQDLETGGSDKARAKTIVLALTTLSYVSLDTIYEEMVTQTQSEIALNS